MLSSQLEEIIKINMDLCLYSNVVFYSEKLLCENQSNERVKYILAKGYVGEGKYHKAYQILKLTKSNQCRYLFTQVCLKLNRFIEAEKALLTDKYFSKGINDKEIEKVIPFGAAGYFLLGIVMEKMERYPEAYNSFKRSLDMDPFMWCSYEKICKLDPTKIDNNRIYTELNPNILEFNKKYLDSNYNFNQNNYSSISIISNKQTKDFLLSPDEDNNKKNSIQKCYGAKKQKKNYNSGIESSGEDLNKYRTFLDFTNTTPNQNDFRANPSANNNVNMTPVVNKDDGDTPPINYENNQIPIKCKNNNSFVFSGTPHPNKLVFNSGESKNSDNSSLFPANQPSGFLIGNNNSSNTISDSSRVNPFTVSGVQHSSFFVNNISVNNDEGKMGIIPENPESNEKKVNKLFDNIQLNIPHRINISNDKNNKNVSIDSNNKNIKQNEPKQNFQLDTTLSFPNICELLKYYSEIYKKIALFECQNAISLLNHLPFNYKNSPYTFSFLGKCYFELGKYKEAENYYNKALQRDPSHLEGLEYLSSALWHLKDQFQCCNLSHHVLEQSLFCPETWIVVGNCFSLQKEHEVAIKFFNRATQINPSCAYAYTLTGHEYVANESYDLAETCYKTALKFDNRSYNAWWGLGQIQFKKQNFSEAIKNFKKALKINSKSALLHFYIANTYSCNKDFNKALDYLKNAEKLDENNPMFKYQISNILIYLKEYDKALSILNQLNQKMPKEAPIHIAFGKIYQAKNDIQKALEHYNIAIDLDPKDSNLARSLIERIYNSSGNEAVFTN